MRTPNFLSGAGEDGLISRKNKLQLVLAED